MGKHWTQDEDALLSRVYSDSDLDSLLMMFPGRPVSAIANRAHILRLRKSDIWKERNSESQRNPKPPKPPKPPKSKQFRTFRSFKPFEKGIIRDMGSSLTIVELKMLMPRRTNFEIVEMAESMGVQILGLRRKVVDANR